MHPATFATAIPRAAKPKARPARPSLLHSRASFYGILSAASAVFLRDLCGRSFGLARRSGRSSLSAGYASTARPQPEAALLRALLLIHVLLPNSPRQSPPPSSQELSQH